MRGRGQAVLEPGASVPGYLGVLAAGAIIVLGTAFGPLFLHILLRRLTMSLPLGTNCSIID